MSVTATAERTIEVVLDEANPQYLPDAIKKIALGTMLTPKKITVSQAAAATIKLDPPAMGPHAVAVRVTAGAAAAGPRQVTDAGGVASATVATLSDDGATLTLENTVTDAVLSYLPRPATDLTTDFATS